MNMTQSELKKYSDLGYIEKMGVVNCSLLDDETNEIWFRLQNEHEDERNYICTARKRSYSKKFRKLDTCIEVMKEMRVNVFDVQIVK